MAYITAKKLTVGYEKRVIGQELDFQIVPGDYLCIVGENGAGKTTLMKTLLGLIKPLGGELSYGDDLQANEIGYLPQQTPVQKDFPASVREIVLSGCQGRCGIRPFYNRKEKERAKEWMEKLDILPMANACYRELSGGQQQRVLLARALCATEKVILLDEPVAGLDPKVTMEMYKLIQTLNKEGVTVIMISHDIEAACLYASHILHIGEEIFYGTKEAYRESNAGAMFLNRRKGENAYA
ncbi:MAG: metal ABC transporter ATP-binding protein [Lachnospiraceae bacterium]|nr:metal ABC transporter ATP-binding protein [Lachnospiraceae bacterium]